MEDDKDEKIEIEVVSGDENELEISPVYDHLNDLKPKTEDENKKKEIIIPKGSMGE